MMACLDRPLPKQLMQQFGTCMPIVRRGPRQHDRRTPEPSHGKRVPRSTRLRCFQPGTLRRSLPSQRLWPCSLDTGLLERQRERAARGRVVGRGMGRVDWREDDGHDGFGLPLLSSPAVATAVYPLSPTRPDPTFRLVGLNRYAPPNWR